MDVEQREEELWADHLVVAELMVALGLNNSAEARRHRLVSGAGARTVLPRDGSPALPRDGSRALPEGELEPRASGAAGCDLVQALIMDAN